MGEHTYMTVEELESQDYENSSQENFSDVVNQKQASKLNRFKFTSEIPDEHKRVFFESFITTLHLYNYYFHSDKRIDNANEYINKIVQYEETTIVPYAVNWSESLNTYIIWGYILKKISDSKSVIENSKLEVPSLENLEVLEEDSYDYLYLTGVECLDSLPRN